MMVPECAHDLHVMLEPQPGPNPSVRQRLEMSDNCFGESRAPHLAKITGLESGKKIVACQAGQIRWFQLPFGGLPGPPRTARKLDKPAVDQDQRPSLLGVV